MEKHLAFYRLTDWYNSSFSDIEKSVLNKRFSMMVESLPSDNAGYYLNLSRPFFLVSLLPYFLCLKYCETFFKVAVKAEELLPEIQTDKAELYKIYFYLMKFYQNTAKRFAWAMPKQVFYYKKCGQILKSSGSSGTAIKKVLLECLYRRR